MKSGGNNFSYFADGPRRKMRTA